MSERKHKRSKADIAKQFVLPERQSKITTLLNQAGQAYCICRSSDSSRFMIACDSCEEWYHGDCINISEREAKYIKNYFCERCREEDPTLKTRFRPQKRENEDTDVPGRDDKKKKRKEKDHSENKSSKRPSTRDGCGECPGCLQTHDCGHCEPCEDSFKYGGTNRSRPKCKVRICVKHRIKPAKPSSSNRKKKRDHHERETYEPEESIAHLQTAAPRQCYGPACARAATAGSKYCSAQCGLSRATTRIYQVLPQRIQEWSLSSCIAEQKNRKSLEVVRSGIAKAQHQLRALDKQHQELDALVARAQNATILHTDDKIPPDDTYQKQPTLRSVSKDNFETLVNEAESDEATLNIQAMESAPKACRLEGRRIINVQTFYSRLQEISTHGPMNCGLSSVEIVNEKQSGYDSTFTFQCKLCNMKFYVSGNEGSEMSVNNGAVLGTVAIGCGHSQLQELSAALELPSMSYTLYEKCHTKIADMWDTISVKTMNDAAKTERDIAISEGRVNDDGVPIIDVIVDGCWSKRTYKKNYSALSGAAVIIGKKTGKILYVGVKNKYCCICAHAEFKKENPKEHKCFKNYCGPSTGMESAILVEGFRCSIDMHGLIYGRMISDGDSATYAKLIETRPYVNTTIQKIECKNHIMRNLCNKLSQLKSDTKYPVRFRKNITDQKIIAIRVVIKRAIEKLTSESESEKRAHVEPLYNDILLAHLHAFGDHSRCKEYFCKKTEETCDNDFRTSSLWGKICSIISNVASHAPSLIHNVESNKAENYNSIIAKLIGGKRINYSLKGAYQNRCKGAAISFNTRALLSTTYKHATGKSPRGKMKLLEQRRLLKKIKPNKKIMRKRNRYLRSKGEDINYGENCAREDITAEIMEKEKITFLNNLKKNKDERQTIERLTVLQSSSSEWLELRRKLLTASNFGRVIKRRLDVSCSNLVRDLLYKDSISHVKSIKHGTDHEKIAIEQIFKEKQIKIEPCGLFIDEELPYLGASPDGLCENMTVEIKCPISAYQVDFKTAVEKKKIPFYRVDKDGTIKINTNHNWYFQIQGQLHITKKSKCLFGLWLGENLPVKIEIIDKDDRFWDEVMKNKLIRFYIDCMLPELIDPRHPRKMNIRDPIYIQKALEEKAGKIKLLGNIKKNENKENMEKEVIETERKIIEITNVGCNNNILKENDSGTANFPNIVVLENGEISDDEEVPYKKKKTTCERRLNFNEF